MIINDREYLLQEEVIMVRHSGEIPEVALHSTLHYLCEDADGPQLILAEEELQGLHEAVLDRYREIILRDLDLANRDRSLFRGVKRALHNWYRFARFSEGIGVSVEDFRVVAAHALLDFLTQELAEVRAGRRHSSLNCSASDLHAFALTLGADLMELPHGWEQLCASSM